MFLTLFVMQGVLFVACLSYGLEILGSRLGIACVQVWQKIVAPFVSMGSGLAPVLLSVWAILPPRRLLVSFAALAAREVWADLALLAACVIVLVFW